MRAYLLIAFIIGTVSFFSGLIDMKKEYVYSLDASMVLNEISGDMESRIECSNESMSNKRLNPLETIEIGFIVSKGSSSCVLESYMSIPVKLSISFFESRVVPDELSMMYDGLKDELGSSVKSDKDSLGCKESVVKLSKSCPNLIATYLHLDE